MNGKLLNVVTFQAAWFCCVLLGARGDYLLGAIGAIFLIALHLVVHRRQLSRELFLLGTALVLGLLADGALGQLGWMSIQSGEGVTPIYLLWFGVLWANFATTLLHCLAWLADRPLLAALLGAVGGAMSYYAGQRLGAIEFPRGNSRALIAIAIEWTIAMPTLATLAKRSAFLSAPERGQGA